MTKGLKLFFIIMTALLISSTVSPVHAQEWFTGATYDKPQTGTDRTNKLEDRYHLDEGSVQVTGKRGVADAFGDAADTYTKIMGNAVKDVANDFKEGNYGSAALGVATLGVKQAWASASAAWEGVKGLFKVGREIGTYTDPQTGRTYNFEITKNGKMIATQGIFKGCIPFPMKVAESKSCLFCPLFLVLFNAANTMATQSFAILGGPFSNVLLIGFALYIAFVVLVQVSAFTKQDAPKFLSGLLTQTFKVVIAYLLLIHSAQIYNLFIFPVLSAGLDFGASMMFKTSEAPGNFMSCSAIAQADGVTAGLLPSALYGKLDCFVRAVQNEIAYMQGLGSSLMCIARNASSNTLGIWDFSMMFQGLVIFLFSLLLTISFAFYLIDAVINIGLVGALMPFLIAAAPFKKTAGYTSKGFGILMNTFFVFVFMGIVISVNMALIGQALTGANGGGSSGGTKAIEDAFNNDNIEDLKELLDIGTGGFLILLCCCAFGFKFVGQADSLAGSMSGGGVSGIGKSIGTMAASGAKNIAAKVTQPARKEIADKVEGKWNQAKDSVKNGVGKSLHMGKFSGKAAVGGGAAGGAAQAQAGPQGGQQASGNAPTNSQQNQNPRPDGQGDAMSGGAPQTTANSRGQEDGGSFNPNQSGRNAPQATSPVERAMSLRDNASRNVMDKQEALAKAENDNKIAQSGVAPAQQRFEKADAALKAMGDIKDFNDPTYLAAQKEHADALKDLGQKKHMAGNAGRNVLTAKSNVLNAQVEAQVAAARVTAIQQGKPFNVDQATHEARKQIIPGYKEQAEAREKEEAKQTDEMMQPMRDQAAAEDANHQATMAELDELRRQNDAKEAEINLILNSKPRNQ